jgi:hypothetical protein
MDPNICVRAIGVGFGVSMSEIDANMAFVSVFPLLCTSCFRRPPLANLGRPHDLEERMRALRFTLVASTILLTFVAGCASAGTSGEASAGANSPAQGSLIVILNSSPGGSVVTAFIVPQSGPAQPLGTIDPGRQAEFPFEGPPGTYRLRLVGARGEQLSEEFQFYRNSEARWDAGTSGRVRVSGN